MTVCHIINPPLTHITNQCLSRHHLLSNTDPNPNLSFSLPHQPTPQPPRPCSTTTAHVGKPPPVVPSSETSPSLLQQWSATATSSPHVPQPPPPSSAPATHVNSPHTTRSHHLCTSTRRKIHHCITTHGLQQPQRFAVVRLFPSRHHLRDLVVNNNLVVVGTSNHHCHTKTARALQHHCDVAATRRSSRASSSPCIPLPEPPFSNQPRRHSLRRPRSLPRHRRHTSQQE
ncbi:hypothetical protein DEO72_LG3g2280 [Vigna unguiculata]|uniref:Uncharacterized protein n=1 Tax=Vigna unguiculata TaxID=3917 RepID=A0A4D6LGV6_VIGUN|nr:hypothetical protein DEO72_LG3g2280 [Vigna unguiculata]